MLQRLGGSLAALVLVALVNLLPIVVELVECSSRKFLTGFLIAYLLAQRSGGGSYGQSYGQSSYGQSYGQSYDQSSSSQYQQPAYPSYSSYPSSPNIYVIPTSSDDHY